MPPTVLTPSPFTDQRVLVTGGAGFIGTALAYAYADAAAAWVAYDNLLPQVHEGRPVRLPASVDVEVGDVLDGPRLSQVITSVQPHIVMHLAAETGTGQSLEQPTKHTTTNVTGTAVLMESLTGVGSLDRVVLTSSRAVYGEGPWCDDTGATVYPGPRTVDMFQSGAWDYPDSHPLPAGVTSTVPQPSNVYGATKLAQEHLLTAWAAARGVHTSILRLQNVYGPGQSPINPYTGITTIFSRIALQGDSIPVYEDGLICRDFVYIDDVVRAIAAACIPPGNVLVDVGTGTRCTVWDVATLIAAAVDAPAPHLSGQFRLGDVRHAQVDMGPSQWVFGDMPPTPVARGLQSLLAWLDTDSITVGG